MTYLRIFRGYSFPEINRKIEVRTNFERPPKEKIPVNLLRIHVLLNYDNKLFI